MKRLLNLVIPIAGIALLLMSCDSGSNPVGLADEGTTLGKGGPPTVPTLLSTIVDGGTVDLVAGKNMVVGTVTVTDDGDSLTVTYDIDDPTMYCIVETHTHASDDLSGVPQTKKGNPKVGHFTDNSGYDCVAQAVVRLEIPASVDDVLVVAAHAVVSTEPDCQSEGLLFGAARDFAGNANPGALYSIDVVGLTTSFIFDTGLNDVTDAQYTSSSPNGLAYDPVNNRHYYMAIGDDEGSDLYVYDGNSGIQHMTTYSEAVPVVGATFWNGSYLAIPNFTADLVKIDVTFDGTGAPTGFVKTVLCPDFNGAGDPAFYRFGDMAVKNDTLWASSNQTGGSTGEFWSIDLNTCVYDQVFRSQLVADRATHAVQKQLSFGSNGVLYAHDASSGEFFSVDVSDATISSVGTAVGSSFIFNDLASGELCIPEEETAWGDGETGTSFPGSNWATYFEYDLSPDP